MNIAEKVKKIRKANKWSQQELAERIGAHITHISRIETDKYKPSVDFLKKIADAFEVTVDYLIDDVQEEFEIKVEDKSVAERVRLIDSLEDADRKALLQIIDTMLVKKKMKTFLEHELQAVPS
ncbi:helix-turn-helix transcriptional regulator [Deltaproteobacteria bacterium TL4]